MSDISNSTPPAQFNTALLFLVFNRLLTTKQVFQAIHQVKPPRLYIAADGARPNIPGEEAEVAAVRNYLLSNIDWECQVQTLFRKENLGCKFAVSSAITWFFEHEEQGIILEDDCLPKQHFFWYCEQGLNYWKHDDNIAAIGGFVATRVEHPFLSLHGSVWGWASWRKVWQQYDIEASLNSDDLKYVTKTASFFTAIEKAILTKKLNKNPANTWDYYWLFSRIKLKKMMVLPGEPLISNIGFDSESSTHTKSKKPSRLEKLEQFEANINSIDFSKTEIQTNKIRWLDFKRVVGRYGLMNMIFQLVQSYLKHPNICIQITKHLFNR